MLYAKSGNRLKKYGFKKYAIQISYANDKMLPFALKILISKIYDVPKTKYSGNFRKVSKETPLVIFVEESLKFYLKRPVPPVFSILGNI